MHSTLATQTSALLQQMLAQSGWLRSELRRLDQAGVGHRCMRDLCNLLDSLDSSIVWDLRDDLRDLSARSSPQAARILEWLRGDVDPLVHLVCRLDRECTGHPLVTAAMIACGEIVGRFTDLECVLAPIARAPPAAPDPALTWRPALAAELPQLC